MATRGQKRRRRKSEPIDIFAGRRPHGVVVTDAAGNQYVARLGDDLTIVDGVISGSGSANLDNYLVARTPGNVQFVFTAGGELIKVNTP